MADSKFTKLKKEATKMGIPFEENIKEEALADLIANKKVAEMEERRIQDEAQAKADEAAIKNVVVLKNVFGEDMDPEEYFFRTANSKGEIVGGVPSFFNKICGFPVDREDMIIEFNRIFKPSRNFLFYKVRDKEVYLVIVPLKYASTIGGPNESLPQDFQKHAISFIGEGSVNTESLKLKLQRVASTIKIAE